MADLKDRINALATAVGNTIRDAVLPRLLPPGGATGHVLRKTSGTNYETEWAAPSGSGGSTVGTVTLTLAGGKGRYEDRETFTDAAVAPSSTILLSLAPHADDDENDPELLDMQTMHAVPGSGSFEVVTTFSQPTSGPIKLNYVVL